MSAFDAALGCPVQILLRFSLVRRWTRRAVCCITDCTSNSGGDHELHRGPVQRDSNVESNVESNLQGGRTLEGRSSIVRQSIIDKTQCRIVRVLVHLAPPHDVAERDGHNLCASFVSACDVSSTLSCSFRTRSMTALLLLLFVTTTLHGIMSHRCSLQSALPTSFPNSMMRSAQKACAVFKYSNSFISYKFSSRRQSPRQASAFSVRMW